MAQAKTGERAKRSGTQGAARQEDGRAWLAAIVDSSSSDITERKHAETLLTRQKGAASDWSGERELDGVG